MKRRRKYFELQTITNRKLREEILNYKRVESKIHIASSPAYYKVWRAIFRQHYFNNNKHTLLESHLPRNSTSAKKIC